MSADQFAEAAAADEKLGDQARSNDFHNFRLVFDRSFLDTVVQRMDDNEELVTRILDEPEFREVVFDHYAELLYGRLREPHDQLRLTEAP